MDQQKCPACRERRPKRSCPALGALICFVQMLGLPGSAWERLLIWLVIGFSIYFLYGRRRAAAERAERGGRLAA